MHKVVQRCVVMRDGTVSLEKPDPSPLTSVKDQKT